MNTLRHLSLLALCIVLGLSTPLLRAEDSAHGKFSLSSAVHWDNAVIPAGDYEFSVGDQGVAALVIVQSARGKLGYLMVARSSTESVPTETSRLILVRRGEERFVSSMQLPESGMTLHFAVPAESPAVVGATTSNPSIVATASSPK